MGQNVKPGWSGVLLVWWALVWRFALAMLLLALPVAVPLEYLGGSAKAEEMATQFFLLAMIPLSIWIIRSVLNKNYGPYRLSIVLLEKGEVEEEKTGSEIGPD